MEALPRLRGAKLKSAQQYQRRTGDSPVNGQSVELRIQVQRFRCLNPRCSRRTIAEDLPNLFRPHARRTVWLHGAQAVVVVTLGGEATSRLLPEVGMPVSADTVPRDVRRLDPGPAPSPRLGR